MLAKNVLGTPDIKSDMKPAIHIQADEIATTFNFVVATIEQTKRKAQAAGFDQIEESVIEKAVQQTRDPSIGHPRHGFEHHIVLRPSDLSLRHAVHGLRDRPARGPAPECD